MQSKTQRQTASGAIASILIYVMAALLMGYTAYRSYDILTSTLPDNAKIFGIMGLAGLDGGLLMWTLYHMHGARGAAQKAVSLIMIMLSLAGILITTIGDSLMRSNRDAMPDYIWLAVLWGVPAIIWTNIAAIVAIHIADPQRKIEEAERDVQHAIDEKRAEMMHSNADQIAADLAPLEYSRYLAAMRAKYGAVASKDGSGSASTESGHSASTRTLNMAAEPCPEPAERKGGSRPN